MNLSNDNSISSLEIPLDIGKNSQEKLKKKKKKKFFEP